MFGDGPLSAEWLAGCRCERVCSDVAAQRLDLVTVAAVMPAMTGATGVPSLSTRTPDSPMLVMPTAAACAAPEVASSADPSASIAALSSSSAASSTPYDIVTQLRKELVTKIGARNQSPMSTVT